MKDYIRRNYSGKLDFDRAINIAKELSTIAYFYPDKNILVDTRKAELSFISANQFIEIAAKFIEYGPNFRKKMAHVIPGNKIYLMIIDSFEKCMKSKESAGVDAQRRMNKKADCEQRQNRTRPRVLVAK